MKGVYMAYTEVELSWIKKHSQDDRKKMTLMFNRHFKRNLSYGNICSLCKRKGWMTGRTGRYKKGDKPYNKGLKLDVGPNKTSFKKGHKPANWNPVGHERVNVDGYIEIKVAEGVRQYRLKHRVIWESEHGEIPPGIIIRFKDNNRLNCFIDNLESVTKHENLLLNKSDYANQNKELKPSIMAVARIQAKIHNI